MLSRAVGPALEVVGASSLAEGTEKLDERGFDLVLLDLGLPDSWGLRTFLDVKAAAPTLPVIVLTASDDEKLALKAVRAGAQDFLVKGRVDADLLHRAIRYALERHRVEQELRESRTQVQILNAELERRVLERTAELSASNQALEAFCYSVSHELRSPLRAIDGFSKALAEEYGDRLDETAEGYLSRIRSAAQRMGALIDGLLQIARVNRAAMERRPTDLSAVAAAVAEDLRAGEPQRQVRIDIEPGVTAACDASLAGVLLEELFSNAWRFTSKRASARIEFGQAMEGGETTFFVRDNGVGFSMQHTGKLFQPFQRLHAPNDFPGTGIGLATVARIVQRHGGRVSAEGVENEGATFSFTLSPPPIG
jgi:light-regulated signal transduction histidine kinase (bacteriophytochrome)/CheY-like chemotaxis protein